MEFDQFPHAKIRLSPAMGHGVRFEGWRRYTCLTKTGSAEDTSRDLHSVSAANSGNGWSPRWREATPPRVAGNPDIRRTGINRNADSRSKSGASQAPAIASFETGPVYDFEMRMREVSENY
jgi:hypothetical protein